jgi:AcrR family transcriptional regulator
METQKHLKVSVVLQFKSLCIQPVITSVENKSVEVRDRIILFANELFLKYGIRSVTLEEIASGLSISKKTIYQYFKDKHEIVEVCTKSILDQEAATFEQIEKESQDVMHELMLISDHIRSFMGKINPSLLYDIRKYFPKAWALYEHHKDCCFSQKLAYSLQRGIEQGYFREDIDIEILVKMRMELVQLAFDERIFPPDRFNFAQVQVQFFEHFVLGICTRKGFELMTQYKEKIKQIA